MASFTTSMRTTWPRPRAEFIRADRLIFLTDVAGVLDGQKVLRAVRGGEIEQLIRQNKVSGGMILKLEAAKRALAGGVSEVRIVGGTASRACFLRCNGVRCPGTRVLPYRSCGRESRPWSSVLKMAQNDKPKKTRRNRSLSPRRKFAERKRAI